MVNFHDSSASPSLWSGFYKKALKERQNQLKLAFPNLFNESSSSLGEEESESTVSSPESAFPIGGLQDEIADVMIENCVGTIGLPVGLALNFVIDSKSVVIPMAVEEPSVIAAVSGAAKSICKVTGFQTSVPERNIVYAQIQLNDLNERALDTAVLKVVLVL